MTSQTQTASPANGLDGVGQSIALWYSTSVHSAPEAPGASAELHFNLWRYNGGKKADSQRHAKWRFNKGGENKNSQYSFLDIGLLLTKHNYINEIFLYFPAVVNNIKDIADKLKSEKLARGVFNEPISTEDKGNHVNLWMGKDNSELLAKVHLLTNGEFDHSAEFRDIKLSGTVLTIKKPALERARNGIDQTAAIYFRFRLFFNETTDGPFIKIVDPKDKNVLSGYERLECVDFRVNEIRNIPEDIARIMTDSGNAQFHIKQIYFLLAIDVESDFIAGHRQFHKCRMLERHLWAAYAEGILPRHMVIYHWRAVEKPDTDGNIVRDFNAFMKFRIRESSLKTILCYISLAFLVGAIGSYAAAHVPVITGGQPAQCLQGDGKAADGQLAKPPEQGRVGDDTGR